MFSRMAPTVLFTAFCVAVAGSYVANEQQSLAHPAAPDPGYIEAVTAFSSEMALALQVGDRARFNELLQSQVSAIDDPHAVARFDPDVLPAPYDELRRILMHEELADLDAFLAAHPGIDLNTPLGRYQSVPLFWVTSHYFAAPEMIQTLLAAGANPGFTTENGYTFLHAASTPFANLFERQGVEAILAKVPPELIDMRTKDGVSVFLMALANAQDSMALALLERGGNPNERTPASVPEELFPGEPPLILAGANVKLVEALLFAGADPLAPDASGTPIVERVSRAASEAEAIAQERVSASEAEEWDRKYAADFARVRDMIRAAADGRLAQEG